MFFGQVHYGHLHVPGQVQNFTISTPLAIVFDNDQIWGSHMFFHALTLARP